MKKLPEIEFTDLEFKKLTKAKRVAGKKINHNYSWRNFIMTLSKGESVIRAGTKIKKEKQENGKNKNPSSKFRA